MKCLIENIEVNYPCSTACNMYGDCMAAFLEARKQRVKTNADRIRTMSDEELANFLCLQFECMECPRESECNSGFGREGADGWLNWLLKPAEDNKKRE